MDETIDSAIAEYLHFKDYAATLEAFHADVNSSSSAESKGDTSNGSPKLAVQRSFHEAFDAGDSDVFFRLWEKHVPAYVRDKDAVARKLEFYLHIRFALGPWLDLRAKAKSPSRQGDGSAGGSGDSGSAQTKHAAMAAFREFLANRGQFLAQTSEFLAYYALPYVPNPVDHPSFQPLFEAEWLADLRGRFQRFIEVILRSVRTPELYARFAGDTASVDALHASYAARENKIRLCAHSVISVSEELAAMLEAAAGEPELFFPGKPQAGSLLAAAHAKFAEFRAMLDSNNDVAAGGVGSVAAHGNGVAPPQRRSPDISVNRYHGNNNNNNNNGAHLPPSPSPPPAAASRPRRRSGGSVADDTPSRAARTPRSPARDHRHPNGGAPSHDMPRPPPHGRRREHSASPPQRSARSSTGAYSVAHEVTEHSVSVEPGRVHASAGRQGYDTAGAMRQAGTGHIDRGVQPAALNYPKIRRDLAELLDHAEGTKSGHKLAASHSDAAGKAMRRCCLLLQSLRWRLTRSKPGRPRRWVLHTYINNDLLECAWSGDATATGTDVGTQRHKVSKCLLRRLLRSSQPRVRESSARLVNAMASESAGRSYMLNNPYVIQWLISLMKHETSDSITRQNALGALQKFSLRRLPQTIMIDKGCIEWIVEVLRNHMLAMGTGGAVEPLSEYSVEYSTALLMNLSLRTDGKRHAAGEGLGILDMLTDFLESANTQVRTYVNGTLYSVLSHPVLKERALSMGLDDILRELMQHSEEQYQRQIQYILDQMTTPADDAPSDEEEEDDDDDDEEDGEDEGEEDDDDDDLQAMPGEPCGEVLLCAAYLADGGGGGAARKEAQGVATSMRSHHSMGGAGQGPAVPARHRSVLGSPVGDSAEPPPLRPITPATHAKSRGHGRPPPNPNSNPNSGRTAVPAPVDVPAAMARSDKISRTPPLVLRPPEDGEVAVEAVRSAGPHPSARGGTRRRRSSLDAARTGGRANTEYTQVFATRSKLARTPSVNKHFEMPLDPGGPVRQMTAAEEAAADAEYEYALRKPPSMANARGIRGGRGGSGQGRGRGGRGGGRGGRKRSYAKRRSGAGDASSVAARSDARRGRGPTRPG